jgi:hypothetical protein
MKRLQEEARARRLQNYGEETEPEYPAPIENLRQQMLSKVNGMPESTKKIEELEEDDDEDEVPPAEDMTQTQVPQVMVSDDGPSVRASTHILTDGTLFKEDASAEQVFELESPKPMIEEIVTETKSVVGEQEKRIQEITEMKLETLQDERFDVKVEETSDETQKEVETVPVIRTVKKEAHSSIKVSRQLIQEIEDETEAQDKLFAPAADS